jgi:hypothetical protein
MPRSKHRQKPDGKAVAHPGRGTPGTAPETATAPGDEKPTEPGGAAPNHSDLRKLPLLAPLTDDSR